MNLQASVKKYILQFKSPAKTSRNTLREKESWLLILQDSSNPSFKGIGECAILRSLSYDDRPDYIEKLEEVCTKINTYAENPALLKDWPSIRFGLEIALKDLAAKGSKILFPSDFTEKEAPISINGLIWMGEKDYMFEQIKAKIEAGFSTIKLKVGAIDFEEELSLIQYIRSQFSAADITLRLDANGAFSGRNPLEILKIYSEYDIHSIEQPIRQGNWEEMAALCAASPLDIALDEELIGVNDWEDKKKLLETIQPPYIILKPSLTGGFQASNEWIQLAEKMQIKWWATSALESNIGLNAIAQWTYGFGNPLPQGLGTGQLYTNNIDSPLEVKEGGIYYQQGIGWDAEVTG